MAPTPPLLAISDRRSLPGGNLLPWAEALAEAEVGALLVREKDLEDRDLLRLLRELRLAYPPPGRLLVSARADLALAAEADGVHLPADGLPTPPLLRKWGGRLFFGRSTHTAEEVEREAQQGVHWVSYGPVYFTPSKASYGEPRGLAALADACRQPVPVYALGGIDAGRLPEVASAGAAGAAGIRCFQDPAALCDLVAAARQAFTGRPVPGAKVLLSDEKETS